MARQSACSRWCGAQPTPPTFGCSLASVRWAGRDKGEPPWTAVRPGGAELLAASNAALPAKDAQLEAAIKAHTAAYERIHNQDQYDSSDW